jgi:hypothetical protein
MSKEIEYVYSPGAGRMIAVRAEIEDDIPVKKSRDRRSLFVKVPLIWLDKLTEINATGPTYRVAHDILWRSFRARGSRVVTVPNIAGVSRNGRRVALLKLEAAGLISIKRKAKKSPAVTVLHGPGRD